MVFLLSTLILATRSNLASSTRKSSQAFRTISEVAAELDVPQHVLRFWESKFSQVKPMKRGGGRRYYRPEDVDLLRGIRSLLYEDGFTIKGVQKVFREHGVRFVSNVTKPGADKSPIARRLAQLKRVSYVEHDAEQSAGTVDESLRQKGRELNDTQRKQLNEVLNELLELKSLIQAAKGTQALIRTPLEEKKSA